MKIIFKAWIGLVATLIFQSCQSYKTLDLDPEKLLKEVEESRKVSLQNTLSFDQAAQLMSERNHSLKVLQLEYQKHQKVADLKTPLPNPVLEFGPAFGSRIDESTAGKTQPFVGIGFSIPLGPRLARQNDVNKSLAVQAYNNTVMEHRKLYFDIKKAYLDLMITQDKADLLNKLEATLKLTKKVTNKLVDVGTSTKIDVTQVNIELAQIKIQKMELETKLIEARAKLAKLAGISLSSLAAIRVREVPFKDISLEESKLKQILLDNNPELARLEMMFHIADVHLKLELAKQYPDLNFGASYEQDAGEKKRVISLPFSIALPVFDRNQQSISAAFSERELQLEKYRKGMFEELNKLELNTLQFNKASEKLKLLNSEIQPLVNQNLKDAEKALRFGSISVLRYLDLLKKSETVQLSSLDHKKHIWNQLLNIEKTIGMPLISFSEKGLKNLKTQNKKMVK